MQSKNKNNICASIYRANLQRTGFYKTSGINSDFCTIKWRFKTGKLLSDQEDNNHEYISWIRSTPIIYRETIFFGASDGYLYALDALSGKEIWKFQTGNFLDNTAVIGPDTIFINNSSNGILFSIDIKNGKEIWRMTTYGSQSTPAFINDILYFGADHIEKDDCLRSLLAIDVKEKKVKWRFKTKMAVFCSPAILNNTIYFGRQGFDYSEFYAVDIKNGNKKWCIEIPENRGATIASTPIVTSGMVIFKSRNGSLYKVEEKTGREQWALQGNFDDNSSAIYDKECIYVCGGIVAERGALYAINFNNGKCLWEFELCTEGYDGNHLSPIATEGTVYCAACKNIYAIDMKTGRTKWAFTNEHTIESIAINDGVLYFGDYGGYLCALTEDNVSYED